MSATPEDKLAALESAFGLIKTAITKGVDLSTVEALAASAGAIVSTVTSVVHAVEGLFHSGGTAPTVDQVKANLAALQKVQATNASIDAAADAKYGPKPT